MKQQNLAQKIGPLFSRLQYEFLWPVIKRFAYILNKMGKLPFPVLDGIPIKFNYTSPLALVRGQSDNARFVELVQTMQGVMGPDATQLYINPKTTPYLLAKNLQIDTAFLNTPEQVAEILQQVQDMQNMQEIANSQAESPEQPENPSDQIISNE